MIFQGLAKIVVKCPLKFEDRWQKISKELDRFGLEYERYAFGRIGENLEDKERCATEDWFNIVEMAKYQNLKNILILEDDIVIDDKNLLSENKIIEFLGNNEWDMFYFGGTFRERPEQVSENIVRNKLTWCLQAVAVNSGAYDKILALKNPSGIGDSTICEKIQSEGKTYCVLPRITYQREGVSSLQGKYLNYYNWQRDDNPNITADKLELFEGIYKG